MLSLILKSGHPAMAKNANPCEGIYYVVRAPEGWRLMPYLFGDAFGCQPGIHHVEFWQGEVAPHLADLWSEAFARPSARALFRARLAQQLRDLYYAFPRGRIDRGNGLIYNVRNGNNLTRAMPTRSDIVRSFGIQGVCEWEFDSHEQCMQEDAAKIKELLKLKETWPAVWPQEP